jgi:hypothetical protein
VGSTARCIEVETPPEKKDTSYQLHVTLRPPAGKSVTRVQVWLWRMGNSGPSLWSGGAGEDLDVYIGGGEDGRSHTLIIEADGFARPKPVEFLGARVMRPLTVDLEAARYVAVRGRVVDATGQPVAGSRVWVTLPGMSNVGFEEPWGPQQTTDAQGGTSSSTCASATALRSTPGSKATQGPPRPRAW